MDTIRELEELALATRLKRLSERLSKDISLVYKKSNIDFEARWFVLISSLIKESPQSITGLAKKTWIISRSNKSNRFRTD
ncbi:MAG: hypothetical protein V1720_15510 [bacterium]